MIKLIKKQTTQSQINVGDKVTFNLSIPHDRGSYSSYETIHCIVKKINKSTVIVTAEDDEYKVDKDKLRPYIKCCR